jgi:hypothetical protein
MVVVGTPENEKSTSRTFQATSRTSRPASPVRDEPNGTTRLVRPEHRSPRGTSTLQTVRNRQLDHRSAAGMIPNRETMAVPVQLIEPGARVRQSDTTTVPCAG